MGGWSVACEEGRIVGDEVGEMSSSHITQGLLGIARNLDFIPKNHRKPVKGFEGITFGKILNLSIPKFLI